MSTRPRHYVRRRLVQWVGRGLQTIFTRTTITGQAHIPPRGPYIAVGNHVAVLEVGLMAINLPHVVELVGNGDVPLESGLGQLARIYGFIPIRRGYIDRPGLQAARAVLEQGHVLGVFPEGGIWGSETETARPGVAWLSQHTGAPILPIGFSGMRGALGQAARLKRPRLAMAIGPLMPPVPNPAGTRARRAAVEAASREIMQRIRALLPDQEGESESVIDQYAFRIEITTPDGSPVAVPDALAIPYGEDLAYYFHRSVLLEVLYRNYRLAEVRPLACYPTLDDPAQLGAALDVALAFYEREPAFLGYRLGYVRARRVIDGLRALRHLLAWATDQQYRVRLLPERSIMGCGGLTEIMIAPSIRREY